MKKNPTLSEKDKKSWEEFLKNYTDIQDKEKKESSIRIRTASFTPLSYSKNLLSKNEIKKIKFEGTANFNQKYIFTNYIYDKNPKYEKKYKISNNYKKIYTLRRGNINVNEIFQKN